MRMEIQELKVRFVEVFGDTEGELEVFHAPGRVNLIGEHTDYNGGYVFPCALSFGTYAVAKKRSDSMIRFASTNFDLQVSVTLEDITYVQEHDWTNYPKGVIAMFQEKGCELRGFDVLFDGNIPNGAGLSSSASIELVTAVLINELYGCNMEMIDLVKLSQRAENVFAGVNCGIMDQFAVGMGKKDQAMFLNCNTLEYQYTPVVLKDAKLVIANTNKRRGLLDSKYNERRAECENAVQVLQQKLNITALGDLDVDTFEQHKYLIESEVIQKRAAHVVYENQRVKEAVFKLSQGDILGFGKLMDESHISLRDLYEVTGKELDALVEAAWAVEGTIGARMTGAGFGGCTVSIVKEEAVEHFIHQVGEQYKNKTGLTAEFYIAEVGDGAKRV